jgi:acyl-CoA synthetase (AMP-forming)/AMP-acid ligase II
LKRCQKIVKSLNGNICRCTKLIEIIIVCITYGALDSEIGRVAAWLAGQGIGRGDRVIVHLRKGISEVTAMFAASRLGAVVVNVNTQWTLEQLAYVARDCGARALIADPRVAKALADGPLPGALEAMLVAGPAPDGAESRDDLPCADVPETPVLDTDLAMIIYTSGSTGKPKGVMLSHRNIVAGERSVARYLKLAEDDRLLSVLPYSFDAGLNQLTTMMLLGGTVVHQPVTMPTEIVRMLAEQDVTGFAGVPPLWTQVVRLLEESPAALPALRRITNTGGKIPLNILQSMPKVFPGVDI